MKLVEIEYEHSSNQLTIDAVRGHFISAINEKCEEVLQEFRNEPYLNFLKTGIHKILKSLDERKRELNKEIIFHFWEYFENNWFVCKFDIFQDIYSEESKENVVVTTEISQHFLHPICKKWAEKLSEHYYAKHPEHKKLYVMDIVQYFPPCPWIYIFWKSVCLWASKNNLVETDKENRWILKSVLYTVDYWSKNPNEIKTVGLLESSLHHSEYLKTLEPPIGLPEWEPQYKERKNYLEGVKTLLKDSLQENDIFKNQRILNSTTSFVISQAEIYCDKVEKHFRLNGWKKVTIKREFEKHLEWTVRFQLKEESYSSIAREFGVYASSVKKEVEEILKLIGIKKREIKRGRKKGQTTSETAKILKDLGK